MRPFYNLRVRFAECEMSQNEVARRAGMAPSTMTARMTGQQPFDAWQMDAIAQELGIDRADYGKYFFESNHKKGKTA
ncbi:MAG TPA: helix-turn-helix domain-containing protein [Candidatus Gemmiger faecavium]|nr:helix-turn-helix domain-containing protein [Candidatus Gemmiger faecavium]